MGDRKGSRVANIDTIGNVEELFGPADHLLSESAGRSRSEDPIAEGDCRDGISDLSDHSGKFAAWNEGGWH